MERQVRALMLPPGPRLYRALEAALDGTGPAVCPLPAGLPRPALAALLDVLAPAAIETPDGVTAARGVPVSAGTAVLIATSGSTGAPKLVELAADALRHSAAAALGRIGARPGERWLCCLPTSHIAGVQVLVRSLVAGTEPVIQPRFDPAAVAKSASGGEADHVALVPTQLRRLLDRGADVARFRTVLLGGAAPPPALLAEARERSARVITTYGMSETCGGCVYDGEPLDGVRVALGPDGRIALAGPVLFTGYRGGPAGTAAALDGGWFRTRDLGELAGGRLRVRGRIDDVINTGGEKVLAGEVAAALSGHPAVRDAVVVGRPDPEWGERVTAVVVPGDPPPDLADLRAWVRRTLPAHAAPRELELVPAIPLLPSGKPDLPRLRQPAPRPHP